VAAGAVETAAAPAEAPAAKFSLSPWGEGRVRGQVVRGHLVRGPVVPGGSVT